VGRGHEVDVVAADPLDVDHHLRELMIVDLLPTTFMGYRPVLTKNAAEVAVGKEDGAGAAIAYQ
jgi:hypothetical protein